MDDGPTRPRIRQRETCGSARAGTPSQFLWTISPTSAAVPAAVLLMPLVEAGITELPRRLQRLTALAEQEVRWRLLRHRKQDFHIRNREEPHLSVTANHLTGTFACQG